jgi:hypothetical protein
MECVRLRIQDVDFAYRAITVRDGKIGADRNKRNGYKWSENHEGHQEHKGFGGLSPPRAEPSGESFRHFFVSFVSFVVDFSDQLYFRMLRAICSSPLLV